MGQRLGRLLPVGTIDHPTPPLRVLSNTTCVHPCLVEGTCIYNSRSHRLYSCECVLVCAVFDTITMMIIMTMIMMIIVVTMLATWCHLLIVVVVVLYTVLFFIAIRFSLSVYV